MQRQERHRVLCSGCGEPRLLFGRNLQGEPVCRPCVDHLDVQEATACRERAWSQQVQEAVASGRNELVQVWVREMFSRFVSSELERRDARAVVRRLHQHLRFFRVLDTTFETCLDVSATTLIQRCDAEILQRSAIYLEFLKEVGYTVPSREAIADLRVTRSADRIVDRCRGDTYDLLQPYRAELVRRKLRPRNIHRHITIAVDFLQYLRGRSPCDRLLQDYVQSTPTHRLGVLPFVTFLRSSNQVTLPAG